MSKSVEIEKGFYLPEQFNLNYIIRNEHIGYDKENNKNIYKEINTDEVSLSYVNQKGSEFCIDEKYIHKKEIVKNTPQKGFSINKNTYSEADYKSYVDGVTVFDPRGFEFSISIGNFLHLAKNNVIDHGEIIAECILSWSVRGTLVLLTTNSIGYKEAVEYTKKQHVKFDPDNLKEGQTYFTKKSKDPLVYMGRHKFNSSSSYIERELGFCFSPAKQLRHVFFNRENNKFISIIISKNIAGILDDEICEDFDILLSNFKNSYEGRIVKEISFEKVTKDNVDKAESNPYVVIRKDDRIMLFRSVSAWKEICIHFENLKLKGNTLEENDERNELFMFRNGKVYGGGTKNLTYQDLTKEELSFENLNNEETEARHEQIKNKYVKILQPLNLLSYMKLTFE